MAERELKEKPKASSGMAQRELDRAEKQFDEFQQQVKEMSSNSFGSKPDVEPQTRMSSREQQQAPKIYLKPERVINTKQSFNEKFRKNYEYDKEYVQFIAENREILGEAIEIWTRPYGGMPAEFWKVPVNKPVWGPRYLAEQIKRKYYKRLRTEDSIIMGEGREGRFYGGLVVDHTVQRLDAYPVAGSRSF